jgi:decaprenylphospho-beta-D-ribofuranose 2-oxidase
LRDLAASSEAELCGWGGLSATRARLLRAYSADEVASALAGASGEGGLIARGAGRSYGDAAQNGGGLVLDATALRGILAVDAERELVRVRAGTAFADLLLELARAGLTLPVVPGTRHLTVGGAIACDVHGKNHPRDGSLGRQLHSLTLCTPADGPVVVSAERQPDLFRATIGGMGLTGVIVEATLRVVPMRAPQAVADIDRTDTLEDALALMAPPSAHRYAIAWIDLLAQGAGFGRSVVTRSEEAPAPPESVPGSGAWPGRAPFATRARISVPRGFPGGLLRPAAVRAHNLLRWRSAPRRARGRTLTMSAHLFPLDVLGGWNRLYGPGGLVQYQFVVPAGQEEQLLKIVHGLRARRLPMYLAVLKRFGPGSGGLLSFPLEGWTLAVDVPADAGGLRDALDAADALVAGAGGRVYLAKDARLPSRMLEAMYPGMERFKELRARVDPRGTLRSDLARRLGLCE